MNWTKEQPKEAGWYWVSIHYPHFRHQIVIYIDEQKTYASPEDWDDEHRESINNLDNAYYYGPLHHPDLLEEMK